MTILYADDSDKVQWPDTDSHDPNSKKYYYISYRPPYRVSETPYIKGVDVVISSPFNGCMYECISGGISDILPPIFETIEGKSTIDNDVKWKCKTYIARLQPGDSITDSTWTSDTGVTLDLPIIIDGISTGIRVTSVDPTFKKFTITNHITLQRVSGRIEEFDKSLVIPVKEL